MESGIYQASIYLKTDAKILNGENVILKAGEIIELQHGFSIELDSKLDVEIEDCNKEE